MIHPPHKHPGGLVVETFDPGPPIVLRAFMPSEVINRTISSLTRAGCVDDVGWYELGIA